MTTPTKLMSRSQLCHMIGSLNAQKVAMQKRTALINAEIKKANAAVSALDKEDIMVSDHAVVRWLERHKGMDLEAVRNDIIKAARPHVNGKSEIDLGDGLILLMDGFRVVTIMPKENRRVAESDEVTS